MIYSDYLAVFILLLFFVVAYLIFRLRKEVEERRNAEMAIAASEEKFRMVFGFSPNSASIATLPGGVYVDVNKAFSEVTGYSPEEVLGKSVPDLKLWKDESVRVRMLEELRTNGNVKELRVDFVSKNGGTVHGSLTAGIVELEGVPHVIAMIRDISAQVLAERRSRELARKLEKQEESLRHIVESSTNLFYSHNTNHELTYVSPQSEHFFECSPEEAKVKWTEFATDSPDNKRAMMLTEKAIATGERQPPYEFEVIGKNGTVRMTEVREVPIVKNGQTIAIVGSFTDITKRKRYETILNNENRFLDDLLKAIPFSISVKNMEGVYINCNPAFSKAVGLPIEEILGRRNIDVFPAHLAAVFDSQDMDVVESGESRTFELADNDHTGALKAYRFVKTPFLGIDSKRPGIISVGIDITESKQIELDLREARSDAESANQAKSAFLANMSHEIRTPINGIMGVLQYMELANKQGELNPYIDTAIQSIRRLNRLLSDILDLSRVEAGKLLVSNELFDIRKSLGEVFSLFEPMAKANGVTLDLKIDSRIPEKLIGDTHRLQQVLSNLVGNALKFTVEGSVSLEVSVTQRGSGKCRLLFSVTDTGIGIPNEVQDKLFNAFVQGNGEQHRKYGGAGLGLLISRRIAELMGGSIALESKEGVGSTFYLNLGFDAAGSEVAEEEELEKFSLEGVKILLAEDDLVSQRITSLLLEKVGCNVSVVGDGKDVLVALEKRPFDLVLMDVHMIDLDGPETAVAIRRGDAGEANKDIPIIALTACAMAGDKERFFKVGMNGYTEKPLELEKLGQELQRIMLS